MCATMGSFGDDLGKHLHSVLRKRRLSPSHLLHHICLPLHMHLEAALLQCHAAEMAATPGSGSDESVACLDMRKMYIEYRSQPTECIESHLWGLW